MIGTVGEVVTSNNVSQQYRKLVLRTINRVLVLDESKKDINSNMFSCKVNIIKDDESKYKVIIILK